MDKGFLWQFITMLINQCWLLLEERWQQEIASNLHNEFMQMNSGTKTGKVNKGTKITQSYEGQKFGKSHFFKDTENVENTMDETLEQ